MYCTVQEATTYTGIEVCTKSYVQLKLHLSCQLESYDTISASLPQHSTRNSKAALTCFPTSSPTSIPPAMPPNSLLLGIVACVQTTKYKIQVHAHHIRPTRPHWRRNPYVIKQIIRILRLIHTIPSRCTLQLRACRTG